MAETSQVSAKDPSSRTSLFLWTLLACAGALSVGLAYNGVFSSDVPNAWQVHTGVMVLGFLQILAFVFVSRSRNRDDDRYHALSAIASNGVWYLTFNSVFFYSLFSAVRPGGGEIPYELMLPFITGTIAGGLAAVHYSKKIEDWLKLRAGAEKKEEFEKLRLSELVNDQLAHVRKRWWLYAGFLGVALWFLFVSDSPIALGAFMLLVYGQNVVFALGSRAGNRNSALYIVLTSIAGTLVFFFVLRILIVRGMPLELFLPYTAVTVLGSITGARVSMIIERLFEINADDHVLQNNSEDRKKIFAIRAGRERYLWHIVIGLGLLGMAYELLWTSISVFGMLIVLVAQFVNAWTHQLARRAGNRDHVSYHFVTRLLWGFGWFFLAAVSVYFEMSYNILIPYLLGAVLGNMFGSTCAMYAERKLRAVMDVPAESKKA